MERIPETMMKYLDFRGLGVTEWDPDFYAFFTNLESVNLDTAYNQLEFNCDTLPIETDVKIILPACGYGNVK